MRKNSAGSDDLVRIIVILIVISILSCVVIGVVGFYVMQKKFEKEITAEAQADISANISAMFQEMSEKIEAESHGKIKPKFNVKQKNEETSVGKNGWKESIYRQELIGKEDSAGDGFVNHGASSTFDSCHVSLSNPHKPKHLKIYVNHLDDWNGNIIKTDTYEYDIGYNVQISREFPFIPGEKSCSVETSELREFKARQKEMYHGNNRK